MSSIATRAGLLPLSPVEDELLPEHRGQELAGDTLDLSLLPGTESGTRAGKDNEEGQFLLAETQRDVALLLLAESLSLGELDQVVKEFLDVSGAGVVFLNHLLDCSRKQIRLGSAAPSTAA